MTSPTTPSGRATLADLEAMPSNDGQRYELIDGHIIAGPWPAHYGGTSFHLGPILAHAVPPGHASYRLCGLDRKQRGRRGVEVRELFDSRKVSADLRFGHAAGSGGRPSSPSSAEIPRSAPMTKPM